jgi:hypothetical protein
MMLARRMPADAGLKQRRFECPQCDEVLDISVRADASIDNLSDALGSDQKAAY